MYTAENPLEINTEGFLYYGECFFLRHVLIYVTVITVFQLGWEKGRVQKKLGTI